MAGRRVLFVCHANHCRSPMAEGLFRASLPGGSIAAESAGVNAADGTPASALAVQEMKRRGIDISPHRARNLFGLDLSRYETAVALDPDVAAAFRNGFPEYRALRIWNIPDPFGGSEAEYRQTADRILVLVEELIRSLS